MGSRDRFAVWKINKVTLWYYPASAKRFKTPLFLIYSLINRANILDLAPGMSMIEAFCKEGYDVYLLDFGELGYEDRSVTLDDYITKYIQKGIRRSLYHSGAKDITIIGYCLGGTLATIYAAVAEEPIRNLILFAPPIDFGQATIPEPWLQAYRNGEIKMDDFINEYGIVPSKFMEYIIQLAVSPLTYSSYLSLIQRGKDEEYVKKWHLFNNWLKGHVPFSGTTLKQLINDLVIGNKLIKNELKIAGRKVNLKMIKANLLVISTTEDEIVPEELSKPIIDLVSSKDRSYERVKGGHVSLALKGKLPPVLYNWLRDRS